MTDIVRYRLDDLRRLATALGVAVGIAPARASSFAAHLLWYDAAGAESSGIMTLPSWLERVAEGEVDPAAEGTIKAEHLGTAVLDGGNGLAPLILARAGELATEKARDAAIGLVRVSNVAPAGSGVGAAIAAELAIGPIAAATLGPGPSWSLALPSAEGLPAVFDSSLAFGETPPQAANLTSTKAKKNAGKAAKLPALPLWAPWASALIPDEGWLVAALSIKAIESLSMFQERVASTMSGTEQAPGRLLPTPWESRRRIAREQGIAVTRAAWARFSEWADRLGVPLPPPVEPIRQSIRSSSDAM